MDSALLEKKKDFKESRSELIKELSKHNMTRVNNILTQLTGKPDIENNNIYALILTNNILSLNLDNKCIYKIVDSLKKMQFAPSQPNHVN